MGPSANDFSNRRRPGRRGDGPARGPGGGPPRDGARGRAGRGLNEPRRPAGGTFRRLGPRPEGSGSGGAGASGSAATGPGPYGPGSYSPSSYGPSSYGPRLGGPRPGGPRVGGPRAAGPRANGPRANGPGANGGSSFERRRWTRDRDEGSAGDTWRRPEGVGPRPGSPEDRDRPRWRMNRRPEGPPARPFRPVRPARPEGPAMDRDRDQPQGDAHAAAAPSELIWGRHAAQAALESERPIHRIWCTPEMRFRPTFLQLLREAKASGALVEEVTWARLGQISGGAVHQGIVLQPAAVDTLDLGSLIDGCRNLGEAPLLVAVDGLTDPQNLGAILRSAEALGVHGLVLPQRRNAGLTGSVAKVAAGALEHLPVARVVNLNRSLETLREEGYRVVGLDPRGTVSLEDADLEGPLVVITGSEGQGLSVLTRRGCDQLVRIPLRGSTPSLNASVATALVLYEVARRGWMRGLRGTAKPPRLVRPHLPTEALRSEAAETPSVATQAAEAPGDVAAERAVESSARGAESLGGLSPGGEGLEAARDRIELAPLEPAPLEPAPLEPAPHVPAPLVVLPLEPAPPEPVLSMPEPPPEPVLSMPEPPLEPVPLDSSSAEPVHSTPVEPVDTTPVESMDTTPAEPAWLETARAEEFSPESGSTDQPSESASPARVPEPPAQAVAAESPVETFATDIHL